MLGPEKLPRLVSELGRWVGRARAMARQFREQLEEEVQLEEARKARQAAPPPPEPVPAHEPVPTHEPATSAAPAPTLDGVGDGAAADPTATRPAQAGSADERRT